MLETSEHFACFRLVRSRAPSSFCANGTPGQPRLDGLSPYHHSKEAASQDEGMARLAGENKLTDWDISATRLLRL